MMLSSKIFKELLVKFQPLDFKLIAGLENSDQLRTKHYSVICIDEILKKMLENDWGMCSNNGFNYLYNGAYWEVINRDELHTFLGLAAERMGVSLIDSKHYIFKAELYNQFLSASVMPVLTSTDNVTQINLQNGTFEITPEYQKLRDFHRSDFLKYQLPFLYDINAESPLFQSYLDTVLPDPDAQKVLAEYLGYVFIQPSTLKLEKLLLLFGSGANGKSVFFDIVNALLGKENISSYSLQKITGSDYSRAQLHGKLVNYASEISGSLDTAVFKQLVSGEPVEARLPYGRPFTLTNYAKLIFNCNELPKEVEHTDAYFRRFLIVPFNVTIKKDQQDNKLSEKIIAMELSGIFNWVLAGLKRLLQQQGFTEHRAGLQLVEQYRHESDSVSLYLEDKNYQPSQKDHISISYLYEWYRDFCKMGGFSPLNKINFKRRLEHLGIETKRLNSGNVACLNVPGTKVIEPTEALTAGNGEKSEKVQPTANTIF